MKWWGWGHEDVSFSDADKPKLWPYLESELGSQDSDPIPPVKFEEVTLPAAQENAPLLEALKNAGLSTFPGTAAEILDDEVRQIICPDKITTDEWLDVIKTAHKTGLPTTATIMFGHVDKPKHWARHLIRVRTLQSQTGGLTELFLCLLSIRKHQCIAVRIAEKVRHLLRLF
jgi:2-iminoacetate synthase ThiH